MWPETGSSVDTLKTAWTTQSAMRANVPTPPFVGTNSASLQRPSENTSGSHNSAESAPVKHMVRRSGISHDPRKQWRQQTTLENSPSTVLSENGRESNEPKEPPIQSATQSGSKGAISRHTNDAGVKRCQVCSKGIIGRLALCVGCTNRQINQRTNDSAIPKVTTATPQSQPLVIDLTKDDALFEESYPQTGLDGYRQLLPESSLQYLAASTLKRPSTGERLFVRSKNVKRAHFSVDDAVQSLRHTTHKDSVALNGEFDPLTFASARRQSLEAPTRTDVTESPSESAAKASRTMSLNKATHKFAAPIETSPNRLDRRRTRYMTSIEKRSHENRIGSGSSSPADDGIEEIVTEWQGRRKSQRLAALKRLPALKPKPVYNRPSHADKTRVNSQAPDLAEASHAGSPTQAAKTVYRTPRAKGPLKAADMERPTWTEEDERRAVEKLRKRGVMFESDSESGLELSDVSSYSPRPRRIDPLWQPQKSSHPFDIDHSLDWREKDKDVQAARYSPPRKRPTKKQLVGKLLKYQCQERKRKFGNPHVEVLRPGDVMVTAFAVGRLEIEKVTVSFREFIGAPQEPIITKGAKGEFAFREGKNDRSRHQGPFGTPRARRVTDEEKFPFVYSK